MGCSDYALHLLTMRSGQPHPAAENPIICYPRMIERGCPFRTPADSSLSITNSRLAICLGPSTRGLEVVVWDWKSGRIVFVSGPLP